jgi:hypothetical protein
MILTHDNIRELREKLQAVLDEFAKSNDLQATVGAASFTPNNVRFQLDLSVVGEDGEAITREAETFRLHAQSFGFSPDQLGEPFLHNGKRLKIVGLNIRSTRFPIIAADEEGKRYKYPAELVRALIRLSQEKQPEPRTGWRR